MPPAQPRRNGAGGGAYRGAQAELGSWIRGTALLRFLRISLPPSLLRWPEAASTAGDSEKSIKLLGSGARRGGKRERVMNVCSADTRPREQGEMGEMLPNQCR